MGEFVTLTVDDGVGLVRLDRPPANAISHQVGTELGEVFRDAADRDDVGSIVVWGGPKIFAAGADIKEMAAFGPGEIRPVVSALGDALELLESLPKVSLAAINGFALGGGLELALACDLRLAAADAQVGQPEIKIGVIPGAGGTQRLARLAPAVARDLVLTGRLVGAEEAQRAGIVDRVLPGDVVYEAAVRDAAGFAHGPREALAAAKAALRAAFEMPGAAGLAEERAAFVALFATPDQREGMAAFLEKREPRFGGGSA
ncbi:MAG TPA: enoyl-CoA hydratase-related protein [Actinomycetota bacterium]